MLTNERVTELLEICEGRNHDFKLEPAIRDVAIALRDLTDALNVTRNELTTTQRELERWKHNLQVEGDYVCPDSLRMTELEARVALLEPVWEAVKEWYAIYDSDDEGDFKAQRLWDVADQLLTIERSKS